jgi:hypothetical protein
METKTIFFLLFAALMMYNANSKTINKNRTASPGEISTFNSYLNNSGMKHDFFKLFTVTVVSMLLVNSSVQILSFDNFEQSLIGRALIVAFTISLFHSVVQPFTNYLPKF